MDELVATMMQSGFSVAVAYFAGADGAAAGGS